MEQSMPCDYCKKDVNELTALDCNHQVCPNCIYMLFIFNNEKILFDCKEEINLKCMKCQTGELKTKRKFIHQICSKIKISDTVNINKIVCRVHYKEVNVDCKECRVPMCQICFDSHKTIPAFSDHQSAQNNENCDNKNICNKHKYQLLFQCLKCNTPICDICKYTDHIDHKIDFIKDFHEGQKNKLMKEMRLPFKTFEELDACLKKDHNLFKDGLRKQSIVLGDTIQSIIDSLIQIKENFLNKTKQIEEEANANYDITKTIYKKLYQELQNICLEDYNNIELISKLPKIYYLPEMFEKVNESFTRDLKEINEKINIINNKKETQIRVRSKRIKLDYGNMKTVKTLTGNSGFVRCLIQLKNGNLALTSGDKTIRFCDLQNDYNNIGYSFGHTGHIYSLIQLQDGKLASASADQTIKLWDLENEYKCIATLTGHTNCVNCLIQLGDGNLASCSSDMTIQIWDHQDYYKCIRTIKGHNESIRYLIQLQDGKLASASADKTIKLWDPQIDYKNIKTLTGHNNCVDCLVQLQDGKLASASSDMSIRIWDPDNDYNSIRILTGHSKFITAIVPLQDGKLATSSGDKTIRLWDPLNDFKCIKTLSGHSKYVMSIIQLEDGKLATGSYDQTVRIWD